MHGLMDEEIGAALPNEAAVRDSRFRSERTPHGCRPLWLTPREAETLLVLCTASPVSGGPGEQDLFVKLGDFFRSNRF